MKKLFYVFILSLFSHLLLANNLEITNLRYSITGGPVDGAQYGLPGEEVQMIEINFSYRYDNSWNQGDDFKDGVHFTYKFKTASLNFWRTLRITNHSGTGNLNSDSSAYIYSPPEMWIGPSENSVALNAVYPTKYGRNISIKAIGIEMVYIPSGDYYIDGNLAKEVIAGADLVKIDADYRQNIRFKYFAPVTDTTGSQDPKPLPLYNGYSSFWMMKYEVTQQQYVDFLNSLNRERQEAYITTNISNTGNADSLDITNTYVLSGTSAMQFRNAIRCSSKIPGTGPVEFFVDLNGNGVGGDPDDGQHMACNYLSPRNLFAYLAWVGLSPLNELQYIKACRGPLYPVELELAYGGAAWVYTGQILNPGTDSEIVDNLGLTGLTAKANEPLRVGFGATATSNRASSGASYYGVMHLSDNVWDTVIPWQSDFWYDGPTWDAFRSTIDFPDPDVFDASLKEMLSSSWLKTADIYVNAKYKIIRNDVNTSLIFELGESIPGKSYYGGRGVGTYFH